MRVDDLREVALKPNAATAGTGVQWHTNAQGMRDGDYATEKPARTFRIALVGDSIGAGWGVNVEDRFESILERTWCQRAKKAAARLSKSSTAPCRHTRPGQRWYHFSQIGWSMNPDLVICESTAADVGWDERRLRFLLPRGLAWDSPIYRQALAARESSRTAVRTTTSEHCGRGIGTFYPASIKRSPPTAGRAECRSCGSWSRAWVGKATRPISGP